MINHICEFETPASLSDYPRVVVIKSIYLNEYHIMVQQTSWFRAPFFMGWGLFVRLCNVWCKKRSVFNYIMCHYIFVSVLITTTKHRTTRNSYRYPRARCLFSLQVPSSTRKATLITSRFKRPIFSGYTLPTIHCMWHRCDLSFSVSAHDLWSRCRFYWLHMSTLWRRGGGWTQMVQHMPT